MPDGPVAAAIVLVAGVVLLGLGYLLTEGLRPGRRGRRHHDAERLPLFGTDQLVVRRQAADAVESVERDADEEGEEPVAPAPRPVVRHERPTPTPEPRVARVERQNGHHTPPAPPFVGTGPRQREVARHDVARRGEPPATLPPTAPVTPVRPAAARPGLAERGREEPFYGWPASPPPAPTQTRPAPPPAPVPVTAPHGPAAAPAAASAGATPPAAFVDGETLRFALPTDGTLQFLPGRLEVVAGQDTGREVRFVRTPGEDTVQVTFGRAEGPVYRHVQLHARTVSRQHATMSLIDEHWELRNLSMTNPVVLNGRVLAHNEVAPLLVDGDRIEMGEVVFLFHDR